MTPRSTSLAPGLALLAFSYGVSAHPGHVEVSLLSEMVHAITGFHHLPACLALLALAMWAASSLAGPPPALRARLRQVAALVGACGVAVAAAGLFLRI